MGNGGVMGVILLGVGKVTEILAASMQTATNWLAVSQCSWMSCCRLSSFWIWQCRFGMHKEAIVGSGWHWEKGLRMALGGTVIGIVSDCGSAVVAVFHGNGIICIIVGAVAGWGQGCAIG